MVTGASSGIGRSTALAFAREGASLVLLARNRGRLEDLAGEIRDHWGRESLVISLDVRSPVDIKKCIPQIMDRFGWIDFLINSAGVIFYKPFLELGPQELDEMMAVNYFGAVCCIQAVLPGMLRRRLGTIVNIGSTAGRRGFPMETGYCASKFALAGFSEALRVELLGTGVGLSLISPGVVDTPMAAGFLKIPGIREQIRPLTSEQVADSVLDAVTRKRVEISLPFKARIIIGLNHIAPGLADRLIRRNMNRIAKLVSGSPPIK